MIKDPVLMEEVKGLNENEIDILGDLIDQYLIEADERNASVEDILKEMDLFIQNEDCGLWVLKYGQTNGQKNGQKNGDRNEQRICGFFTLQLTPVRYLRSCVVHHLHIDNGFKGTDVFQRIMKFAIDWSRQMGVDDLYFLTSRNIKAWERLCKGIAKSDSTLMRIEVNSGVKSFV